METVSNPSWSETGKIGGLIEHYEEKKNRQQAAWEMWKKRCVNENEKSSLSFAMKV
jgi:hypothetical protein